MNEQALSIALQKNADVVVRIGINLRVGQRLFILAGIFDYPLARLVAASAYRAGARLVSNSSPVSRRGHLFYNMLFDENAASHIAIGRAYRLR